MGFIKENLYKILMSIILLISFFILFFLDSGLPLSVLFGQYPQEFTSLNSYMQELASYEAFLLSIGKLQFILPILAVCATLGFREKVYHYFVHFFVRKGRYKETIIKELLKNSFEIAGLFYIAYIFVDLLAYILLPMAGMGRFPADLLFADILGTSLYTEHIYLFSILSGFIKIFLPTVIYSLFAMILTIFTKKTWKCLVFPILYHLFMMIVIPLISYIFDYNTLILYFSPSFLIQPSGFSQPITAMIFVGYIPYLIIFGIMLYSLFRSKERLI